MVEKWASLRTAGERRAYLKMRARTYENRLRRSGFSEDEIADAIDELRDGVRVAMEKRRQRLMSEFREEKRAAATVISVDFGRWQRLAERRKSKEDVSDATG